MRHPGSGDPAATGQSGRRRFVLEFTLEHGFRPTRHRESAREDHDRRGSGVYAACVDAQFAGVHRLALSVGIATRERPGREPEPNTRAAISASGTTAGACDITSRTGSIAGG